VIRELEPGSPRRLDALCDAHIESGYEQMRLLGDEDAPADRATDDFASATQYAGVVYGKAAAFYRTLEQRFGREEVTAALGAVTERHAFGMLGVDDLRAALAAELDDPAFDRLWRRWMQGTRGDLDLDVDPERGAGGLGGLGGLGGGETGDLDQLLEQLLGDGGSPQGLEDLLGTVTEPGADT
jgi:hypothetical protein